MVLGSSWNAKKGLLTCVTLNKQWLIENLCAHPKCDKKILVNDASVDLHSLIREKVMEEKSDLNHELIQILIVYGKTK